MDDLLNVIIGNEPLYKQLGFIYFALLGMFLIKLWRYNVRKKELLKNDPPIYLKFNFKYWLNDNFLDFICAFITSFLVHRFLKDSLIATSKYFDAIPEFTDDMFYGLLLGLCFQFISHKIMNKLKIVNNG